MLSVLVSGVNGCVGVDVILDICFESDADRKLDWFFLLFLHFGV